MIEYLAENRVLTDIDRKKYSKLIDEMFLICPEMMRRKIPEANVQQAFVLDFVRKLIEKKPPYRILSVGCFEDTAYECLKKEHIVYGIDPAINFDLHTFIKNNTNLYDIIFSTSVIEHVVDDEEFIRDICSILLPDGIAILTCDFNNDYKPGDRVPDTVVRQYTTKDFGHNGRLDKVLQRNNCVLEGIPMWDTSVKDFTCQGCKYSFATYVFRKL